MTGNECGIFHRIIRLLQIIPQWRGVLPSVGLSVRQLQTGADSFLARIPLIQLKLTDYLPLRHASPYSSSSALQQVEELIFANTTNCNRQPHPPTKLTILSLFVKDKWSYILIGQFSKNQSFFRWPCIMKNASTEKWKMDHTSKPNRPNGKELRKYLERLINFKTKFYSNWNKIELQ